MEWTVGKWLKTGIGLYWVFMWLGMGCTEDRVDFISTDSGKYDTVETKIQINFSEQEEGYALANGKTKSSFHSSGNAFDIRLLPEKYTKSLPTGKPDKLYNLEIWQFNSDGSARIGGMVISETAMEPGDTFTASLSVCDHCQLIFIVRGKSGFVSSLKNTKTIPAVQLFTANATSIRDLTDINDMPYILHLKDVNVTASGFIRNPEGEDVRVRLKRLAAKLNVNWTMSAEMEADGYQLKEVKLCQVPSDFRILPKEEISDKWGKTYPVTVSVFRDVYRLTGTELTEAAGNKEVWIPANVRGTSPVSTSPQYRTRENAPVAASYLEFVVDNSAKKERLYYRAYLGGSESTDYNLYENTDYNYSVNIQNANYTTDGRIQLLDQTPVASTNLVNTANCIMLLPGGNLCFNPYKHTSGTNGWNNKLVNTPEGIPTITTPITSIKVLWQTKDGGTSGDLVLGYVIDETHHENLVQVTDASDSEKARVHVKAPLTAGGNAVIAAYSGTTILWSWHIWVTDYVPACLNSSSITNDATRISAIEAAQAATRNGMVQVYGGVSWTEPDGFFYKCVSMDRNLGATRAGIQQNLLDAVRTFGLVYQAGRKDPFFSTADGTTSEVKTIYDGYGVELSIARKSGNVPYNTLIQNPNVFFTGLTLFSGSNTNTWNEGRKKTIYDPCPDGWCVPINEYLVQGNNAKYSLCAGFGSADPSMVYENQYGNADNVYYYNGSGLSSMKGNGGISASGSSVVGSGFLYLGGSGETIDNYTEKSAFFPGVSLREYNSGNYRPSVSNNSVFLWSSTISQVNSTQMQIYQIQTGLFSFQHPVSFSYGFSVRCVQENR